MSTGGRAAEAAGPRLGALTQYAIASWPTRARHGVHSADVPSRQPPPMERGYGLQVEVEPLDNTEEDNGWAVLATTVSADVCTDAESLQASQAQHRFCRNFHLKRFGVCSLPLT
jgi:hypothetical protein